MAKRTRNLVQILFFTGFVTLWYLTRTPLKLWVPANLWLRIDPLLAASNWIAAGRPASLFWPAVLMLAAGLLWGRVFCGWACPVGTLLDWETMLLRRLRFRAPGRSTRGIRLPRLNLLVLAVTLGASALGASAVVGLLDPLVFVHRGLTFLSRGRVPEMLLVVLLLSLAAPRFWCRYLCPLGGLLGAFRLPLAYRRRVDESCAKCGRCAGQCPMGAIDSAGQEDTSACLRCGTCREACPTRQVSFGRGGAPRKPGERGINRRQFLLALAGGVSAGVGLGRKARAATGLKPETLLRAPGSLSEANFLDLCVRCGECVKVCPTRGLIPTTTEAGWQGIWTPHLVPRIGECKRCMLCGRVCPTGAIRPIPVSLMKIGTAKLNRSTCWAWNGAKRCRVCFERCPKKIIRLDESGRPTVDEAACDGCGYCEKYCPVKTAAITVSPEGERRRDQTGQDAADTTVREEL